MKKLHQSKVLNNLDQFRLSNIGNGLMRQNLDMFLFWKIIEYVKPNSILEIGTFAGQTLGLMIEASGKTDGIYTSVDLTFDKMEYFKLVFDHVDVEYIKANSKNLNLTQKYDVIHIDGNHQYEYVKNDFDKITPCLYNNSILILDDYGLPDVDKAIDEFMLGPTNFVPFMQGHQATFFHHSSHDLNYFLDEYIFQNNINDFIELDNIDYKGHTVLKGNLPNLFVKHHHLFLEALKLYDI